jgi:uncharacterized membrane protein
MHPPPPHREPAVDEDIGAIKVWEEAALHHRSSAERLSEGITRVISSGYSLVLHALWFGAWILVNTGILRIVEPFDPFPFPLLTMAVSLEAIFLSLFVLSSQNRMSRQSDKRAHLDLQIDMLAEREMTAVLVLLRDLAKHFHVRLSLTSEQLRDLSKDTDIRELTSKLKDLPEE